MSSFRPVPLLQSMPSLWPLWPGQQEPCITMSVVPRGWLVRSFFCEWPPLSSLSSSGTQAARRKLPTCTRYIERKHLVARRAKSDDLRERHNPADVRTPLDAPQEEARFEGGELLRVEWRAHVNNVPNPALPETFDYHSLSPSRRDPRTHLEFKMSNRRGKRGS